LRGLMKQHIDSFDHFVSVEMRQIVQVSGMAVVESLRVWHTLFSPNTNISSFSNT